MLRWKHETITSAPCLYRMKCIWSRFLKAELSVTVVVSWMKGLKTSIIPIN